MGIPKGHFCLLWCDGDEAGPRSAAVAVASRRPRLPRSSAPAPPPWLRRLRLWRRRRLRRNEGEEGAGEGEGADEASGAAPAGDHEPDAHWPSPVWELSPPGEGGHERRARRPRTRGRVDR